MEQSLTDGEEQHGSINVKLAKFPIVYNVNASYVGRASRHFFGHIHRFFSQVQQLMFVGGIFWSRSIVHVRRCEFHSVIF